MLTCNITLSNWNFHALSSCLKCMFCLLQNRARHTTECDWSLYSLVCVWYANFIEIEDPIVVFWPASPKAKAGLWVVQSLRPSACPSVLPFVHPKILSSQLLWKYRSNDHETWYVDRTSYGVQIGRKFWSPNFCGSYAPWNLQNIRKSTNNLNFFMSIFYKWNNCKRRWSRHH